MSLRYLFPMVEYGVREHLIKTVSAYTWIACSSPVLIDRVHFDREWRLN